MRVTAGYLGGRVFDSPASHRTHPMADRVRGGLFNALGDITELSALDAFAGSGAIGFEALSRGASSVLAIESDKSAQRTIKENAISLDLVESYKLVSATVLSWLSTSDPELSFDLIFADPPYDDLQLSPIVGLSRRLRPSGTMALSWPGRKPAPLIIGLDVVKQKSYGDAQIIYYRPTVTS